MAMEAAKSPFPPASDVPLQRNPPLAPSQELAYRNKCIQLKRRLQELEAHNDQARKRIGAEKDRVQKQRLLRSLLLHQLREIMETPGKQFSAEELEKLGIAPKISDEDRRERRPDGEVLLDDSSEESEEDIPEPSDRPTRIRRQMNGFRSEISIPDATPVNAPVYHQSNLPTIAPANSYSPAAAREPMIASTFQTPVGAAVVSPSQYSASQQPYIQDSRYPAGPAQSSPIHAPITVGAVHHPQVISRPAVVSQSSQPAPAASSAAEPNGFRQNAPPPTAQPLRPEVPYKQFCDHMRPQLEADNYPAHHIGDRINEEWRKLSEENRSLWEERYQEQMRDYEEQMDEYKRASRYHNSSTSFRR